MSGPDITYVIGSVLAVFGVVGLIASSGKSRLGFPVVAVACVLLTAGLAWRIAEAIPWGWAAVTGAVVVLAGYALLAKRER